MNPGRRKYTLYDVYIAAKFDRHFNYVFWMHITLDILSETLFRYAGYALVVTAVCLIALISALGFLVVHPMIFEVGSPLHVLHVLAGVLMVFSIYFNYFMAVTTQPGYTEEEGASSGSSGSSGSGGSGGGSGSSGSGCGSGSSNG
ncbi:hypothetical protein B484DRAFT_403623, partial [Ochromonadaceae sp. CCMP2298]